VRVLEVTFAKGVKIPAHSHPDHAVYVLTPGEIEITTDGKPQKMELTAGQAVFIPAQTHAAKNTGKTAFKLVVFELKP
jgi:quercetin dioxygenase-like cupin family protein